LFDVDMQILISKVLKHF